MLQLTQQVVYQGVAHRAAVEAQIKALFGEHAYVDGTDVVSHGDQTVATIYTERLTGALVVIAALK